MKIGIVGAGWFGCHIANILIDKQIDVVLFEKEADIFLAQSGFNSNRLHLGFHYPRAKLTRIQCQNSFKKFIIKYPSLVGSIKNNLIGIHVKSKTKFLKYVKIMNAAKLNFSIVKNFLNLKNIDGLIKCNEMFIKKEESINFFKKKLIHIKKYFNFEVKKIFNYKNFVKIENSNEEFDWVIDCSACSLSKKNHFNVLFEPRITLLYRSVKKNFAIMLMDGNFWSIYPIKNNLFTVGSVIYSRLAGSYKKKINAEKIIANLKSKNLPKIITNFEKQIIKDYPKFKQHFKYVDYYTSIATLKNSAKDERPFQFSVQKKVIKVLGGKIDTVIEAGEKIEKILKVDKVH